MGTDDISVGTKAELEFYNCSGSKIGSTFTGEFAEIVNDMYVIILIKGQVPVQLSFLENLCVRALYDHKTRGLLSFEGIITQKEKTKNGIKFHIKIDDDYKNIQKREYFRPACFLKTEYRLVKELNNSKSVEEVPYKSTETKNISATGVCIFSDATDDIQMDDLVDLIIWFSDTLSIAMRCKIVRIMEFEIANIKKYEIGMLIQNINENDKANLTKFITQNVMVHSLYWGESPLKI